MPEHRDEFEGAIPIDELEDEEFYDEIPEQKVQKETKSNPVGCVTEPIYKQIVSGILLFIIIVVFGNQFTMKALTGIPVFKNIHLSKWLPIMIIAFLSSLIFSLLDFFM